MVKNVKIKYPLNSVYGVSTVSNSDYLGVPTKIKIAEIISKCIANSKGFCYADTDSIYARNLDKKS